METSSATRKFPAALAVKPAEESGATVRLRGAPPKPPPGRLTMVPWLQRFPAPKGLRTVRRRATLAVPAMVPDEAWYVLAKTTLEPVALTEDWASMK